MTAASVSEKIGPNARDGIPVFGVPHKIHVDARSGLILTCLAVLLVRITVMAMIALA
jgi:hypothetical protein